MNEYKKDHRMECTVKCKVFFKGSAKSKMGTHNMWKYLPKGFENNGSYIIMRINNAVFYL